MDAIEGMRQQKELALAMKTALLKGRLDDFGWLLGQAWQAKKKMSPRITTPLIDEIYEVALQNGAAGGKVTGAGGGGFMLLYVDFENRPRVAEALDRLGVTASGFLFRTARGAGLEALKATWLPSYSISRTLEPLDAVFLDRDGTINVKAAGWLLHLLSVAVAVAPASRARRYEP